MVTAIAPAHDAAALEQQQQSQHQQHTWKDTAIVNTVHRWFAEGVTDFKDKPAANSGRLRRPRRCQRGPGGYHP
ncbi:unnamed protein product [Heligmosomoides polygyrus]|uniref:HTH_48 domain-containing protein n=1 Tax=Heligmosomoides polygyrus TaxID=6339 RepID=A0A183G3B0_HELPZ|nr:unnamed protein product [Heligmosomoides polygyrus]